MRVNSAPIPQARDARTPTPPDVVATKFWRRGHAGKPKTQRRSHRRGKATARHLEDRSARGLSQPSISRRREVNPITISDLNELFALLREREEGQTMAEYGVVLAVITIGAVGVFTLLSGGITGAINKVIGLLPK